MEKQHFVGYEYHKATVKRGMASLYADGYENFGWELENTEKSQEKRRMDTVALEFKRDRKIRNKAELTRLQRNFDACIAEILSLEAAKRTKAAITAFTTGIIGTVFMAGSVFAVTSGKVVPCIILAVPAFIGWILPYFLYQEVEKKKTSQVAPLIEQKYEELYTVCEKAHGLLNIAGE